jgi:hypothetical protein
MRSYSERKKRFLEKQKRAVVQNWLSSFVVTAVVVVAAVVIVPRIPKASIITTEVFGNDVYYQVEVEDSDATIVEGSLKIVAKSATEQHEQSLTLGWQQGSFGTLNPNTDYEIQVLASYGFGEGVLAKSSVKTKANYGGRIIGWSEVSQDPISTNEMLLLEITTRYNDLKNEIASVRLKYATLFLEEVPQDGSQPLDLVYSEIVITSYDQVSQIELFAYETVQIYLILEATLITNEIIVLDQTNFPSPLKLHASFYEKDVGPNYVEVFVYPDFYTRTDIVYQVNLIKEGEILATKEITYVEGEGSQEESTSVLFSRLKTLTKYHVQLLAKYVDTITNLMVEVELGWLDLSTTPPYSYNITSERSMDQLNITIELNDPNTVLSNISFYVYTIEDGIDFYQSYMEGVIIDSQVTISIPATEGMTYKVQVNATKTIDENTIYQWLQIATIVK